jgi:hypothetical protein
MISNQVNNIFFVFNNENRLRTDIASSIFNPFLHHAGMCVNRCKSEGIAQRVLREKKNFSIGRIKMAKDEVCVICEGQPAKPVGWK